MELHRFSEPLLALSSYVVADEEAGLCAVIDPCRSFEPIAALIREKGWKAVALIETHVHADFLSGAVDFAQALPSPPPIYCSAAGGAAWLPEYADCEVSDGDIVPIGAVRLQALHTPGHTPEHIAWLAFDDKRSASLPCSLFSGDLLFVGSVGRPDLLGEGAIELLAQQLYSSLFDKVGQLADYVEVLPAHSSGSLCGRSIGARATTTLGYERLCNPYMEKVPFTEWKAKVLKGMPPSPPIFAILKQLNRVGAAVKEPPSFCDAPIADIPVIDVRSLHAFAKGHVPQALHLAYAASASFTSWLGWLATPQSPFAIALDAQCNFDALWKALCLIGLDQSVACFIDMDKVEVSLATLPLVSPQEAVKMDPSFILDVRSEAEWHSGHIAGAVHVPLPSLLSKAISPLLSACICICGSGYRSSLAASFLCQQGREASSVAGGMQEWRAAGLAITDKAI